MRLLFDENLSHNLVSLLADPFPDSVHVREVGLKASDDPAVWEYAKNNELLIVSKDSDMHQRSFVFGIRRKWSGFGWATARHRKLKAYCESILPLSRHFMKMIMPRFLAYQGHNRLI
jgi:predicted nuclease of predicted toxin-antitoxin system